MKLKEWMEGSRELFLLGMILVKQEKLMLSLLQFTYESISIEKDNLVTKAISFRKFSGVAGIYEVCQTHSSEVNGEGKLIFKPQKAIHLASLDARRMRLVSLDGELRWYFLPENQRVFYEGVFYQGRLG